MGRLGLFVVFSALVVAEPAKLETEPEGAVATGARWTDPRGCASGSCRSAAAPVVTEIEEAWQIAVDSILTAPVCWDGVGYFVKDGPVLVVFDVRTGEILRERKLKGFSKGSALRVWDSVVFVEIEPGRIHAYRFDRGAKDVVWLFRGLRNGAWRGVLTSWCIHDYELYGFFSGRLGRLRPGSTWPVWLSSDSTTDFSEQYRVGAPAVFGQYVVAASLTFGAQVETTDGVECNSSGLALVFFDRTTGEVVTTIHCELLTTHKLDLSELTVTAKQIYIRPGYAVLSTKGEETHVIIATDLSVEGTKQQRVAGIRSGEKGKERGNAFTMYSFDLPPASLGTRTLIRTGKSGKRNWSYMDGNKIYQIATEEEQPELFRDSVRPTVLGDIVYFGSWAADIRTREVLWNLPVRKLKYPAVPIDGMILIAERGKLRAFRGRSIR